MDVTPILRALEGVGRARIAVFGDYALDKYLYIDPARDELSVETGLTAYQVEAKRCFAGAAGTIVNNLRALGAQVVCIGLAGDDGEGFELLRCLEEQGADTAHMVCSGAVCTSTYVKPMRRQPDGSYAEMNRLDLRSFAPLPLELERRLLKALVASLPSLDAVIVMDQFVQRNLGAVTDGIRAGLGRLAAEHPEVLFYADSRAFACEYRNMIVKCNNLELMALGGGGGNSEDAEALLARAEELLRESGNTFYVTRGSKGMMVFEEGGVRIVPAYPVTGPVDIVGAGDASSAGIVLGLTLGLTSSQAAVMACCVSSITIQQIGCTGTASIPQLIQRLKEYGNEGEI
ncbi:PfkB domain protein [uncultured Eubacteriales bacterium]|uniref:PfkB domain protein n=1 Tax=uncultured Eubacteriales bacterium TaxID=172733 RepID=A0A212JUV0_9FIRM|nr:PfkB domain protein [uncultured Eubacteriales bacterium]